MTATLFEMTIGLTQERVRDIVTSTLSGSDGDGVLAGMLSVNAAAPEIARLVLEWAAKRCDDYAEACIGDNATRVRTPMGRQSAIAMGMGARNCAAELRQMVKEIKP